MKSRKPAIAISLLIVALGIAWLLNAMRVAPQLDWIWIIGLGVSGILLLLAQLLPLPGAAATGEKTPAASAPEKP